MSANRGTLYWDACVFLSLFAKDTGRRKTIETILADAENHKGPRIITSILTQVEVAYVRNPDNATERDPDAEQKLDAFWQHSEGLVVAELTPHVAEIARRIIRSSFDERGSGIKASDAVHLATAEWLQVDALHTYDKKLLQAKGLVAFRVADLDAINNSIWDEVFSVLGWEPYNEIIRVWGDEGTVSWTYLAMVDGD